MRISIILILLMALLSSCGQYSKHHGSNNSGVYALATANTTMISPRSYFICSMQSVRTRCLPQPSNTLILSRFFPNRVCLDTYRACLAIQRNGGI